MALPASVVGLEIELIAHATEDVGKVIEAARAVLPSEARDKVAFKTKELKGHHGNPIRLVRATVRDRELARAIFEHVISGLPEEDRAELLSGLKKRLSKGTLYIRLDKQRALLGQLRLCTSDPIRLKARFSSSKLSDVREACEEAGLSLEA